MQGEHADVGVICAERAARGELMAKPIDRGYATARKKAQARRQRGIFRHDVVDVAIKEAVHEHLLEHEMQEQPEIVYRNERSTRAGQHGLGFILETAQ